MHEEMIVSPKAATWTRSAPSAFVLVRRRRRSALHKKPLHSAPRIGCYETLDGDR